MAAAQELRNAQHIGSVGPNQLVEPSRLLFLIQPQTLADIGLHNSKRARPVKRFNRSSIAGFRTHVGWIEPLRHRPSFTALTRRQPGNRLVPPNRAERPIPGGVFDFDTRAGITVPAMMVSGKRLQ